MNKNNVLKTKIILCINISHLLRIKKLICYISHFCFFNSATLEKCTCCQKTTRQNSSETAWKEYRLTFSYQTWEKNTNIRNGCHCYYCFGQILRRLRQVNADQIKTSRRVSPLHSVDGRRPVRVLLLGWNFSFQLVPQWLHLLRRIICSCRYFIHILNYFYSFFHDFIVHTTACLRLQVNPANKGQFEQISPERAFADFIFAHVVLHLTVMNFIG